MAETVADLIAAHESVLTIFHISEEDFYLTCIGPRGLYRSRPSPTLIRYPSLD